MTKKRTKFSRLQIFLRVIAILTSQHLAEVVSILLTTSANLMSTISQQQKVVVCLFLNVPTGYETPGTDTLRILACSAKGHCIDELELPSAFHAALVTERK